MKSKIILQTTVFIPDHFSKINIQLKRKIHIYVTYNEDY